MSGLRFSADTMNELIDRERELATIMQNAERYAAKCEEIRDRALKCRDAPRMPTEFFEATEGMNAVRIILAGIKP